MKSAAYFVVRHLIATGSTVLTALILWTIGYLFLLLWAMFGGEGLGSPLTYPLGLLAVFLIGTASCLSLFLPATGFAEWIVARFRWPILCQIPVALSIVALLVGGLAWLSFLQEERGDGELPLWAASLGAVACLAIPLGYYWWLAQFLPLVKSLAQFLLKKLKK